MAFGGLSRFVEVLKEITKVSNYIPFIRSKNITAQLRIIQNVGYNSWLNVRPASPVNRYVPRVSASRIIAFEGQSIRGKSLKSLLRWGLA